MRPAVNVDASSVLVLAGVVVLGFVAWRAYRGVSSLAGSVGDAAGELWAGAGQTLDQAAAEVVQRWRNATSAPAPKSLKSYLYDDEHYTGGDAISGEWFGSVDGRRYEYELADLAAAGRQAWRKPAAVSSNGAAFGIYPKP